jgi:uncharacterized oligopeptide transporter (OPT) family protein
MVDFLPNTGSKPPMALKHLTEEQISTWTREQKDRWWFDHIYRGDMPQLTLRSALTGFLLGAILAATALYIAAKTGIGIGVGLTSVILAFAIFKGLSRAGLCRDFTILENNCTQSIATAAGYMTQPLSSSLVALMLVTGFVVPWWQMLPWMIVIALIGVLVAFPLKRKFINDEQMPFPEGRAAGVVLDTLYSDNAGVGFYQAKLLGLSSAIAAFYQFLTGDGWMKLVQFKILRMNRWLGLEEPWRFHDRLDDYYYLAAAKFDLWIPKILGTELREIGMRGGLDVAMLGIGGLMGSRVSTSVLVGTVVNFMVLVPIMIQRGDIAHDVVDGIVRPLSRAQVINKWSLWWAVTMMVVGSFVGLLGKPETIIGPFRRFFAKKAPVSATPRADVLAGIELPLWVSFVGIPIFGLIGTWMAHSFFGANWKLALLALPLIFVLSIICSNAMALTSWTPTGPLSKVTQFSMGALDRTNPATNLAAAGMTAEVCANAGNLLSDIKPGYMLGAKPRQQAVGHVIGIFSGALAVVPLFFLLFLPPGANGVRSTATMVTDKFAFPAAIQWKGVADLITKGLHSLPTSAIVSMAVAAVLAAAFEIARIKTKGKFPLSPVAIGLGVTLPPDACIGMWAGAAFFWIMSRRHPTPGTKGHNLWVVGVESICAGLISGAALVGIGDAIVNVLL